LGQRQKKIALWIDIFFGLIFPVIVMAASYVVQDHRFNVFEGVGCQFPEWQSVASICIVHIWPVVLSLVSAIYGSKFSFD